MRRRIAPIVLVLSTAAFLQLASQGPAWATSWVVTLAAGSAAEAHSASAPPAPTGVAATCVSPTNDKVKVSWSAVTGAASYAVYQSTTAATGPYSQVASGIATLSWTSGGLSTGNYWFEVRVFQGTHWQSALSAPTGESTTTSTGGKTCTQP